MSSDKIENTIPLSAGDTSAQTEVLGKPAEDEIKVGGPVDPKDTPMAEAEGMKFGLEAPALPLPVTFTSTKTEPPDAFPANPSKKRKLADPKTSTTKPKPKPNGGGNQVSKSLWTPEEEATLLALVKDHPKATSAELVKLLADQGIHKIEGAIANKKRRLKAMQHEWTQEQIDMIKKIVEEKKVKVDPYTLVAEAFMATGEGRGVKKEAALKKLKELEKEGKVVMEGVPGFKCV